MTDTAALKREQALCSALIDLIVAVGDARDEPSAGAWDKVESAIEAGNRAFDESVEARRAQLKVQA